MWEWRNDKSVQAATEKTNGLCGTSEERGHVGQQGVCWSGWISLFGDKCLFCLTLNREASLDAFNQRLKMMSLQFGFLKEPFRKMHLRFLVCFKSNKERNTIRQDTHYSEWILSVKWKSCSCPSACREENRGSSPWGPLQQRGFLTRCTLSLKHAHKTHKDHYLQNQKP